MSTAASGAAPFDGFVERPDFAASGNVPVSRLREGSSNHAASRSQSEKALSGVRPVHELVQRRLSTALRRGSGGARSPARCSSHGPWPSYWSYLTGSRSSTSRSACFSWPQRFACASNGFNAVPPARRKECGRHSMFSLPLTRCRLSARTVISAVVVIRAKTVAP